MFLLDFVARVDDVYKRILLLLLGEEFLQGMTIDTTFFYEYLFKCLTFISQQVHVAVSCTIINEGNRIPFSRSDLSYFMGAYISMY